MPDKRSVIQDKYISSAKNRFDREPFGANQFRERLALDIFHSDEDFTSLFAYFENRADVRMIQG